MSQSTPWPQPPSSDETGIGTSSDPPDLSLPRDAPTGAVERASLCFGVPLRLRCSTSALLDAMLKRLPHAAEIVPSVPDDAALFSLLAPVAGDGFRFFSGHTLTAESATLEPVLEQLGQDLMVYVADMAPERIFVHAGVVGWRGRAIVLPGSSFAGKTTLTAALVRAGATYYSDEYAVLDAAGQIHPYARDLQMRQPGESTQRGMSVHSLQGVAGETPLRAAAVHFVQYRPGAVWAPQPVSPGMAVLEMLRHTIPVQRTPARVMAALAAMLEGATAWQSERDEAGAAAHALLGSYL